MHCGEFEKSNLWSNTTGVQTIVVQDDIKDILPTVYTKLSIDNFILDLSYYYFRYNLSARPSNVYTSIDAKIISYDPTQGLVSVSLGASGYSDSGQVYNWSLTKTVKYNIWAVYVK